MDQQNFFIFQEKGFNKPNPEEAIKMRLRLKMKYENITKEVTLDTESIVLDLRIVARECFGIDPSDDVVLTYCGRALVDDKKRLGGAKLSDGCTVTVKVRQNSTERTAYIAPGPSSRSHMIDYLNNPLALNIMKNPDCVKSIIKMFPGLEGELDRNAELRQILNNPTLMDEMGKMSCDPEYLNQQSKNADLMMARLETLPGGLNMINSMVKEFNDPLTDIINNNTERNGPVGANNNRLVRDTIPNPAVETNWLVVYRKQLNELNKFGFTNIHDNLKALKKCNGNLSDCILYLADR